MSETATVEVGGQAALLDLTGREFNAMWVDENQPLFVANNPLHWQLHKLQVAIERLEKQAEKNPAQFNSTTYINTLEKMAELMKLINNGGAREIPGSGNVASGGTGRSKAPAVGDGASPSLHPGISADNPAAG